MSIQQGGRQIVHTLESLTTQYQLLPDLSDEDYQALKADIAERGVLVPIEVDEQGNVLDGHHRQRAWRELKAEGVRVGDLPRQVRGGWSEAEKRNHVRALNLLRRHLTREQLHEQIVAMREDGASTPEIARATGISDETVRQALSRADSNNLESGGLLIANTRGQKRPARYAPRKVRTIFVTTERDQQKALGLLGKLNGSTPDKPLTLREATHLAKHLPANLPAPETGNLPAVIEMQSARLYAGDFQNVLCEVPDASVDLIFTDPPYIKAFLPQWSDLSALAARVLKPTGMLIAYSGQAYLPEVMGRLAEHLQYWWLGAVFHGGASEIILADYPVRKVVNLCKPLLFYVRPGFQQERVIHDAVQGEGSEKGSHAWQQGQAEAEFYIRRLCPEGGIVLDPCLGGGTTGVAAVGQGRQFIGCEIDPDVLQMARERIENERRQAMPQGF
ncbi:MAG: DNA methyltransferase [Pseudomonadota bacterium]